MSYPYYAEALKLGQKAYRISASKGTFPYLPVLDDFIPAGSKAAGTDLGIVQIPSEFIIGTKSRGRTEAFASNYMPLLSDRSEFADKWSALCRAHLSEGIRDPIKVYEYLNRYYVVEGNKRVSVLKFFDAPTITGHVTRILPERTGEAHIDRYYEFLKFHQASKIVFLELSRPGGYAALQKLLGKAPDEAWSEEDRQLFSSAFYRFKKAYESSGGSKIRSTVGDALLAYIEVYGYPALHSSGDAALKKSIGKMWEELELQQEEAAIEVKTVPAEEKKQSILTKVLPVTTQSVRKVAFLYDKTPELSGWTHGHEIGRQHVQRVFDGKIETTTYENALESDGALGALECAVADGCNLIFATSPRMFGACLRIAVDHPETVVMNCTTNQPHRYVRSYYGRMYEAKFIIGAIAATLSDSNELGYIADYPIYGQIAGINAFALGAQMVNPRAKVVLSWSSVKDGEHAEDKMAARGIRLISSQDTARLSAGYPSGFGLDQIAEDGTHTQLASPIWRWDVYYETILRRMLDNTVKAEYESSSRALNYYWGMSAGVIDLHCSELLPRGTRRLADYLRDSICKEVCNPFLAPLHTQDGSLIGSNQHALSMEQIIAMDYLVDNIVGSIPSYDDLTPLGQAAVDAAGIEPSTKFAGGGR